MESGAWKLFLNLNCNSGCVSKDREASFLGVFAVTELSGVILKRRFKDADVLVYGGNRTTGIGYK